MPCQRALRNLLDFGAISKLHLSGLAFILHYTSLMQEACNSRKDKKMKYTIGMVAVAVAATVFLVSFTASSYCTMPVSSNPDNIISTGRRQGQSRYVTEIVRVDNEPSFTGSNGYAFNTSGYLVKLHETDESVEEYFKKSLYSGR